MSRFSIGLAALLASSALHAQMPANMQDAQAMMKAMEDAQAAARQPGDEALTCGQLEEKVIAAVQDPAFQSYVQARGEAAQQDQAASQLSKAQIAARTLATAAAATMPGASMAQLQAARVEHQAKMKQGQARQQALMQQAQDAMKFLPLVMRAQRLVELGLENRCEWAAAAAEGVNSPDAPAALAR